MHDYNLALTKEELVSISNCSRGRVNEDLKTLVRFFDLIDREADRLGDQQGE